MPVDPPLNPSASLPRIRALLQENDAWRGSCLNLIASENVLSPAARAVLDTDLLHRYAEGRPALRYYEGTRYVDEIETLATEAMRRIFRATFVDVRPMAGTVANEAVFSKLVSQGATVVAHTIASGGHISHSKIGSLGKRTAAILPWPMMPDGWHVDPAAARDLIARERPELVVFGRSLFLFPEPLVEVREACAEVGARVFYDGAHVLGLIAGGIFQDPLDEGADVLAGSTHKTFFGPQRGVVLSGRGDPELWKKLDKGVFPGSSSNHHLFSLPALLVATLEMEAFGAAYARDTVTNAQALARALHARGLDVAAADLGYTRSHQVAVDVARHGGGKAVSRRLAEQDIICNMNMLPGEPPRNATDPRGIRLGVQEMTRFGMGPDAMEEVAELIRVAIEGGRDLRHEVRALRARFPQLRYGFSVAELGP